MRIETVFLILGAFIALLGLLLLADAFTPDRERRITERRRRARPERHRVGEGMIGAGIVSAGIGMMMRDTWNYTNLALYAALALFVAGIVLNYRYLRGRFFGPTRGRELSRRATDLEPPSEPKIRVR